MERQLIHGLFCETYCHHHQPRNSVRTVRNITVTVINVSIHLSMIRGEKIRSGKTLIDNQVHVPAKRQYIVNQMGSYFQMVGHSVTHMDLTKYRHMQTAQKMINNLKQLHPQHKYLLGVAIIKQLGA